VLRKIAITGPESSGKTTLAAQLAAYYKTEFVPEFARSYLPTLGRDYIETDLLDIAKGQLQLENKIAAVAKKILFCDSDMTVMKIWAMEKYGRCDAWITAQQEAHHYDLYLLCAPDIPWEADPFRENPTDRNRLFALYIKELEMKNVYYIILEGGEKERLEKAVAILDAIKK
jgi:NadR type nicotinamide-nucleotide adenylyltransferase